MTVQTSDKKEKSIITVPLAKKSLKDLKKGEKIMSGTNLFQEKLFETKDYDIRTFSKIPLEDFLNQLFEKLGKQVEEGDILAQKGKKIALSPITGLLSSVTDDGVLKISKVKLFDFQFPFDCEILEINDGGVKVSFDGEGFEFSESYGESVSGNLNFIDREDLFGIIDDVSGSIVVLGEDVPFGFLCKLSALGAVGFVVESLSDILKKRLEENIDNFSVMVFSKTKEKEKDAWEILSKKNKSHAFFSPEAKILIVQ